MISEESSSYILLNLYQYLEEDKSEEAGELKLLMEETLGKKYIKKFDIFSREAMALGLLKKTIDQEILNDEENPEQYHVHASFRARNRHVISLDITELCCHKINFLNYIPNLEFLRISMAGLKEIEGLENLPNLTYLDLSGNKLNKVNGLEHLTNLKHLDLNLNKLTELNVYKPIEKLETLMISFNPLIKLEGIDDLKDIKHVEMEDTKIPKLKIKEIKRKIGLE